MGKLRIEQRTVFVVCVERPPVDPNCLPAEFFNEARMMGTTWSGNDEELYVCDTLETAQAALARYWQA